jgi:[ribosomal protein S18]-alanine N-acetyltransferase
MNALVFEPAQIDELERLATAEELIHRFPWTRGQFADSLRVGHPIWIMREHGEFAGYAVLMPLVDEIELLNISVLPEKQQRGLGRALLMFLIDKAQEAGLQRMFLEVRVGNLPARMLYERTGFAVIGERRNYYPAPGGFEDAIIMAKQL